MFSIFYENEKRMRALKMRTKNSLNMNIVVNYLNFTYHIEIKTKSKYKILNFLFQLIKNMNRQFGYTDSSGLRIRNNNFYKFNRIAWRIARSPNDKILSYEQITV